jgi:hypothetical protein
MLRTVRIPLKEYAGYLRRVASERLPQALRRGLVSGAMRCVTVMQRRSEEAGVFNLGTYKRAWRAVPTERGAKIMNDLVYAAVIELGRRAGARMPPSDAIARWAQRKLSLSELEARSVGFVIARAIARRGLPPRYVLTNALPELVEVVREELRRELTTAF